MNLLNQLGWQVRGEKRNVTRYPLHARDSSGGSEYANEWDEKLQYQVAAERYSNSDLIYMCIKKLGDMSADGRLMLFPKDAERDPATGLPRLEDALTVDEHPFYQLWDEPNPQDSKAEMLESIITTLMISPKGVFLHLDDGERPTQQHGATRISLEKEPVALWWLLPEAMTINADKVSYIKDYLFEKDGNKTFFEPNAIVRIVEFNPTNRYQSLSRIQPILRASASDMAAQEADFALFKNGLRPSAIIQSDRDRVDPDELAMLRKLWDKEFTGSQNWHKLFPLWAGFKFEQFGISPADAQTNETSARNRMRIFGVLGVHPGIILSEDVNLANAKVAEHVTRAFTLKPLLRRVADEISPILESWPDAPPAEAHFVNVVPQDEETEAQVEQIRAATASQQAQALATMAATVGVNAAVVWAIDKGLLPDDFKPDQLEPMVIDQTQSKRRQFGVNGFKQAGNIVPVLPQVPFNVDISEAEIDRALAQFYGIFPELTGTLETGVNGRG